MRRADQGLASAGLIILFALLAAVLAIALPIIKADAEVKLSDWLGFSGNVIAALFGFIAAAIAWTAAQKQLRLMRVQNDIVSYEALQKIYNAVDADYEAVSQIIVELMQLDTRAKLIKELEGEFVTGEELNIFRADLEEDLDRLDKCDDDMQTRVHHIWGSAADRKCKEEMRSALGTYTILFRLSTLMLYSNEKEKPLTKRRYIKEIRSKNFYKLKDVAERFSKRTEVERARLLALMDELFVGFGRQ